MLLTAHGTADRVKLQLRDEGHQVHDATCPLVKRVHLALAQAGRRGPAPGRHRPGRTTSRCAAWSATCDEYTVILDEADLEQLAGQAAGWASWRRRRSRWSASRRWSRRSARRFPEADVRFIDTVCQPTKDRQEALRRLVDESDVVVVVGGPDSNNSRKLTELARSRGRPAYQVARAGELRPEWFDGVRVVGLTAGTSTPDDVIEEVRAWLAAHSSPE